MPLIETDGDYEIIFGPESRISKLYHETVSKAIDAYQIQNIDNLLEILNDYKVRLNPKLKFIDGNIREFYENNPEILSQIRQTIYEFPDPINQFFIDFEKNKTSEYKSLIPIEAKNGGEPYFTFSTIINIMGVFVESYLRIRLLASKLQLESMELERGKISNIHNKLDSSLLVFQSSNISYRFDIRSTSTSYVPHLYLN